MKFAKVRDVKSPQRNLGDAGFDFFIPNDWGPKDIKLILAEGSPWHADGSYLLEPGCDVLIPSGIHVCIPPELCLIAFNKSGRSTKDKLIVGACVVDESYQGEVHLHLFNNGKESVTLKPGEKALQFLLIHAPRNVSMDEVNNLKILYAGHESNRGAGAFGSTGLK